jgi:hypothetical protein
MIALLATLAHALPGPCGTPDLLRHRGDVAFVMFRPNAMGYVDSLVQPIRVHYARPQDLDRINAVLMPIFENAWTIEMDQMGWMIPPPDAGIGGDDTYDVYLTEEGTFGGAYTWGYGDDVIPGDGKYSVPTYIAIDDRIPDDQMGVFFAHELNHASQYAIDAWEYTLFPWESTADAVADMVDDASDLYMRDIEDFNEFPFLSLLFDGYTDEVIAWDNYSFYEYGGSIFSTFLEERYGNKDAAVLIALWDAMAQEGTQQEPDFVDGLRTIDPANPSALAVYTEFAVWRMFVADRDDGAHYEEAALWPIDAQVGTEPALALASMAPPGLVFSPQVPPYDLGTAYVEIPVDEVTEDSLEITLVGDAAAGWGIAAAAWPTAGGPAWTGMVTGAQGAPVVLSVPLAGASLVQLGFVNGGPDAMEVEDRPVPQRTFDATIVRVPPPPEDTGSPPVETTEPPTDGTDDTDAPEDPTDPPAADAQDEEKGGCTHVPGAAVAGWLGAALLVRRKRCARS